MFWLIGIGKKTSLPKRCRGSQPKKLGLGQDLTRERGTSVQKAEAPVITAARLCLAAEQTSLAAPEGTNARHFAEASWAVVKVITGHASRGSEREGVTALFGPEAEIAAGQAPLGAVRINEAPRVPGVGHEMGQFVEVGAGQFGGESKETGIEQNEGCVEPGQPGRGAQPRVPVQGDARGQAWEFEAQSPGAGFDLQLAEDFRGVNRAGLERARGHRSLD